MKPAHRRAITLLLVGMFGLITLAGVVQIVNVLLGVDSQPPILFAMQIISTLLAAATAFGAWKTLSWSALTAIGYGVVTAVMIISLGPLLALPDEARSGLLGGALGVLGVALLSAWQLGRITRPDGASQAR